MTQEQEAEVQRLIKDVDVTELMGMLMKHGNRYSRRILKFFRWYCKYMPISLMFFHAYGIRGHKTKRIFKREPENDRRT